MVIASSAADPGDSATNS